MLTGVFPQFGERHGAPAVNAVPEVGHVAAHS
jgi:hypothetical protein